jgi:hypothetical protein
MAVTEPTSRGRSFVELLADPQFQATLERLDELRRRPRLAVLDTSFIRSGLAQQVRTGRIPASLDAAHDGTVRLLMEWETLEEAVRRLPRFAGQLGVPVDELARILNEDWLPHVHVLRVPDELRSLDARATRVRDADVDDYPAGALAALVSPCIVLTHNVKDFNALGVRHWKQAYFAVSAAVDVEIGERRLRAVVTTPAVPVVAVGAGVKWAGDRLGPVAYLLLAVGISLGILYYRNQPEEKKESIKKLAGAIGNGLLEEGSRGAEFAFAAQQRLDTSVVPGPERRSLESTVIRQVASAQEPVTVQDLHATLDPASRPSVVALRAFLHVHKADLFSETSLGRFVLGRRMKLIPPVVSI